MTILTEVPHGFASPTRQMSGCYLLLGHALFYSLPFQIIMSLIILWLDVNMWAVENIINNTKSKMNELAVENTFAICVSVLKDRPQCLVNVVAFGFICNLMAELELNMPVDLIYV
jgi:hypothetical protein